MMNVIKTAIITIIISIISGLLLEHFKNLAPRILCSIGNGVPMGINNKKVYAYSITVSNISKKIIHELTLNIQSSQSNLKIVDAKITKGLKFSSLIKDNILDIDIPFLSKGDKFSVTVYVESQNGLRNKPIIVMRSPENFKQVDSIEKKGILSLFNRDKVNEDKVNKNNKVNRNNKVNQNKKISQNKKVMIVIASIALVMVVGVLAKFCLKGMSTNTKSPSVQTNVNKQPNDAIKSSESDTTKNTDVKAPTGRTTRNTNANTSTGEKTKNTDTKAPTGGTTKNTDTKAPTGGTTKNTDTKAPTGETTGNTDEKTKNTDTNTSTGGTTGNTDTKPSTDGTAGSTGN